MGPQLDAQPSCFSVLLMSIVSEGRNARLRRTARVSLDRAIRRWQRVLIYGLFSFLFAQRASAALLARALRCSGVSFFIRAGPLFFPPLLPCSRKKSRAALGSRDLVAISHKPNRVRHQLQPTLDSGRGFGIGLSGAPVGTREQPEASRRRSVGDSTKASFPFGRTGHG